MISFFKNLITRLVSFVSPPPAFWFENAMAAVVPLTFIALWWQPFWLWKVVIVLAIGVAVCGYRWWQQRNWSEWLAGLWMLLIFWYTALSFWLFLENNFYRVIFLVIIAFFTWWYLQSWRAIDMAILKGERMAGSLATFTLGWLTIFMTATSSSSILVYLDVSWWKLVIIYTLIVGLVLWSELYAAGWSWLTHWTYWFVSVLIAAESFLLVIWWPTSFYVIGFTMATVHLLCMLVWKQEAQGFLNRRSLRREIIWVVLVLLIVLITARWT